MKRVSGKVVNTAGVVALSEKFNVTPAARVAIDFGITAPVNDFTALIIEETKRAMKKTLEEKHDDPAR